MDGVDRVQLSEINQADEYCMILPMARHKIFKHTEAEHRTVHVRGWEERETRKC